MTNAEKYFGDKDIIDQFISELSNYMFDKLGWYEGDVYNLKKTIECFLKMNIKPTLTEDEKVILKNIKKDYITIARDKLGDLFIATERDENGVRGHNALEFNRSLFQFIKDGEEYEIAELLKGE